MNPKIKICGLKYPENIRDILALQPDYIGFIFHPTSKRFIEQLDAEWVAQLQGVKKTGVFVNDDIHKVTSSLNQYRFQAVQLHGNEPPAYCAALKDLGVETIKAFGIDNMFNWAQLADYEDVVNYYMFDTQTQKYGGSGKSFDWKLLREYPSDKPFFLSGGISADNIRQALQLNDHRLYALDLNSKFETEPGMKDIELLKKTIQTIGR
ncbi:phosphoribosylanthranilate isomerase [Parapedobacter tibetensis]|uniref:phosphoribosylanthranilate isomerase n=1 Tax=Parapedobacter tibetensis TaxID=2972951 RepID=UPI00214D98D8|nr:phosphoribosylanthranilate isomerase [Parapedobacter tibetensis]